MKTKIRLLKNKICKMQNQNKENEYSFNIRKNDFFNTISYKKERHPP